MRRNTMNPDTWTRRYRLGVNLWGLWLRLRRGRGAPGYTDWTVGRW